MRVSVCGVQPCQICGLYITLYNAGAHKTAGKNLSDGFCDVRVQVLNKQACHAALYVDVAGDYRSTTSAGETTKMCDFVAMALSDGRAKLLVIELTARAADRERVVRGIAQLQAGLDLLDSYFPSGVLQPSPSAYLVVGKLGPELKRIQTMNHVRNRQHTRFRSHARQKRQSRERKSHGLHFRSSAVAFAILTCGEKIDL